ncbi:MAG: hypothetical protein P8L85_18880, partial [Rubripirellula sp.]|nr:hypothetical protein [Rubripirellula sp.]
MKSFGKSFGVRAAIGAATILSGVYAAALAQKDRQDHSVDWSANPPSLGQPVAPIEGQLAAGQISAENPAPDSGSLATMAGGLISDQQSQQQSVQLVQHTEPAGIGMELPASLAATPAEEAATDSSSTTPANWSMPPAGNPVPAPAATAIEPPTMAFPAAGAPPQTEFGSPLAAEPAAALTPPAELAGAAMLGAPAAMEIPADLGAGPAADLGASADLPVEASLPTSPSVFATPPMAEQSSVLSPELNAGQVGAQGVADLPNVQLQAASPYAGEVAAAAVATGATIVANDSAGGPANLLRSDAADMNGLRGVEAAPAADQPNAAPPIQTFASPAETFTQPESQFAQPAVQFAQPESQFTQPTPAQPQFPTAVDSLGNPPVLNAGSSQSITGSPSISGVSPATQIAGQPSLNQQPLARTASLPAQASPLGSTSVPGYPPAMEQPLGALPINPNATVDAPGERRLEGAQTPSVVIQKRAPAEVKVGKPAAFVIQVQNVGSVEALDVKVQDRIPAGMRLVDASPAPIQQGNLLVWQLGSMPAGDERTLTMQLVPEQEGELGSVARVSFEAAASVRTIATRPELKVTQNAPETVLIGQQLEIELEVSNPGSGDANGVILQEDVPEGLDHPKGRQLDNALGTLAAGEIRKQLLRLRAVAPGVIQNTIRLTGEDGLTAENTVTVQVVAPELRVAIKGPSKRYLERSTTYQIDIANAGTADATNVEVGVQLARGLKFVSTDFEGQYDPTRHSVFWSLAQLPAGQSGTVPLTLLPVEEGEQAILIDAKADLGVTAKGEQKTMV